MKGDTIGLLVAAARATRPASDGTTLELGGRAGRATVTIPAPPSINRTAGGHRHKRARRKSRLEQDLTVALLSRDVPRPIPGDRVHATAVLRFPVKRRRDEGNYRGGDDGLEKALGDALDPHSKSAPYRWLSDDSPEHYTFGELTFEVVPGVPTGGLCELRLTWGDRRRLVVIAPSIEQVRLWARAEGLNLNVGGATAITCPRALHMGLSGITAAGTRVVIVNGYPGRSDSSEAVSAELWARQHLELAGITPERVST